jgi:SulP family sulfate permease
MIDRIVKLSGRQNSFAHSVTKLVETLDTNQRLIDIEKLLNAIPVEAIAAARVDENLYFANANQVENKLLKVVQRRPSTKHMLLVCSAINMIDISGLEMLYRINQTLEDMGIKLHLSEVKGPVMDQLEATDFILTMTGSVFFTTDQAMRDLAERA